MADTFHIVNGSFEAIIYLDHIHTMPLKNWRKLVKLAAGDYRNEAALEDVSAWFTAAIADAKEVWKTASQEYVDGWKDPRQRGQKTKNKELARAVKSTKAHHDHLLKMQYILIMKRSKSAMSTNTNIQPTKVITGKCRLSYSHVWDPVSIDGNSEPKYGACIIIPKSDKVTLKKIKAAVEAATQEGIKSKWKGKKPVNLKLPLRDGDEERPDDEAFAGCYFLNANSKTRPGIVDLAKHEIMDTSEVYSGCYCRFSINFYPFSTSGNNGVAAGLNNIQKVADGTPLGGRSRAEDDFDDDYEGDEDFSDLD